jgi:hypothetical protein
MADHKKIAQLQSRIKMLSEKLNDELDFRKRELLKFKISILETKIKIERLSLN